MENKKMMKGKDMEKMKKDCYDEMCGKKKDMPKKGMTMEEGD